MYGALLQDWTTIEGASSVATLTQSEAFWLDTSQYLDLVTFLQVVAASGCTLSYQTAPTKDESLFQSIDTVTLTSGVTVGIYLRDTASFPLSHWLRWSLGGGGTTWNVTFRIWVALNQPGGFAWERTAGATPDGAGDGPEWSYAPSSGVLAPPAAPSLSQKLATIDRRAAGNIAPPGPTGPAWYSAGGAPRSRTWRNPQLGSNKQFLPPLTGPAAPSAGGNAPRRSPVAWNPFIAPGTQVEKK